MQGSAGVQTHNKASAVVELLHKRELFLQIHACRTAHRASRLGIMGELDGNQASRIQYKIGFLQETLSTDRNRLRVAGVSTYNLYVTAPQHRRIHCHGEGKIIILREFSLGLVYYKRATVGRSYGTALSHAPYPGDFPDLFRRIGYLDILKLRSLIHDARHLPVAGKLGKERLVLLKLYSRQIFNGKRAQTIFDKSVFNEMATPSGQQSFRHPTPMLSTRGR